ncbi:MAG: hypothetical protein ABSB11_07250 [Sedimentisphaerales bacterium]|jgi:thiamine kinase-like enzyme
MSNLEIAKQIDKLVMNPTNMEKWRDKVREAFNLFKTVEKPDLFKFLLGNDPLENIETLYLLLALCHDDILHMNLIITDDLKKMNVVLCAYPQCATYAMQRISIRMDIYLNHVSQDLEQKQGTAHEQLGKKALTEKWYKNRTIQAAFITAITAILLGIITIIFKNDGSIKIGENQNSGQQTIISNKGDGNVSVVQDQGVDINRNQNLGQQPIFSNKGDVNATFVQNQGLDPNKLVDKFGDTQKVLGKTEYELEKIKRENQELLNIVNAYKIEDKEKRAALERAENTEKTKILVKIFQAQDKGNISKEEVSTFSDMVNKTPWEDLKSFLRNKDLKIDEHNQSLVFSGIFKVEVKDDVAVRMAAPPIWHPEIIYILTPGGNKLYEIAKDVNF